MIPLISTVFLASLMGSLHCAGMCGAFVAIAVSGDGESGPSRAALNAAYNGGRLVSYTALGVGAGALGAALDLGAAELVGVQRLAAVGAGAIMVLWGAAHLLALFGWRTARRPTPPRFLAKALEHGHRAAAARSPMTRALAIGLLSTLLPCGWLYAFVVVAAGTGSPLAGGLTMAVFWGGTLPVLIALGVGVQRLLPVLRQRASAIAAVAVTIVGLYTMTSRLTVSPALAEEAAVAEPETPLVDQVQSIDQESLPCCHGGS